MSGQLCVPTAVARPGLILDDQELSATVLASLRRKRDGGPRRRMLSPLLAVRALDLMNRKIKVNICHVSIPIGDRPPNWHLGIRP